MIFLLLFLLCTLLCGCSSTQESSSPVQDVSPLPVITTAIKMQPTSIPTSDPVSVMELLLDDSALPVDMSCILSDGWTIHLLQDYPVKPEQSIDTVMLLCPEYPDARVLATVHNPYEIEFPVSACEVTELRLTSEPESLFLPEEDELVWEEIPRPDTIMEPETNWYSYTTFSLGGKDYSLPINKEELLANNWLCCDDAYLLDGTDYYLKLIKEDGSGFHIMESNVCLEFVFGSLSCNSGIQEIYRIFGNQWDKHIVINNRHYITYSKDNMSITIITQGDGFSELVLSSDSPSWDYVKYNLYMLYR